MRVLFLDIETTPNLAHVWGLWDQNVGLNQLEEVSQVLCFAAKWDGEKKIMFSRNALDAHDLLNEADVVVHYNGKRFDIPHLNREFLLAGMVPPTPYKQVDLLNVVKQRFKFPSNKLEYVARVLELGGKAQTGGFELWKGCMEGKAKAWATMEKYNKQDVALTEKLYYTVLPWIGGHPNRLLYDVDASCPTCGSGHLMKRGFAYTNLSKFQQFQCQSCGSYFRGNRRLEGASVQTSVL